MPTDDSGSDPTPRRRRTERATVDRASEREMENVAAEVDEELPRRRAADPVLATLVKRETEIRSKVESTHKFVLACVGLAALVVGALGWFGYTNQSPGKRITDLADALEQVAKRGEARDSLHHQEVAQLQDNLSLLQKAIRDMGYTVCLSTAGGRTAGGATSCAEKFLLTPQPVTPAR